MAKAKSKKITIEDALVPVEEQPYEVPENWCWIHLLDAFDNVTDSKKKLPTKEYQEEGEYSIVDQGQEFVGGYTDCKDIVYDGDMPVIIFGDHTRCVKYVDFPFVQGADGVKVLSPKKFWDSKAFYYAIQSVEIPNMGYRRHYPLFKNFSIPVPPLPEQQRIVEQIESLFSKLDEAKEKAEMSLEGFSKRKESILYKAFRGELTDKYRKLKNPNPATEYLNKLVEQGKIFSRKDFSFWENSELPTGWAESKIGNLLYFAGRIGWKGLKAEEYTEEGPLFLSVYNLNDGDEVTYNRVYHITKERYEESPEIMVQVGDVLLTKDGAGIGKLGYVKELPQDATINSSLLLIRPGEVANPKYVFYLLSGPELQEIVRERITGSATPHLFQRDIKEFLIPIPPMDEQKEIVSILDDIFRKESKAYDVARMLIEQVDLMKKSILAKAFRGELGTNNPDEESSIELIKNIIQEQ